MSNDRMMTLDERTADDLTFLAASLGVTPDTLLDAMIARMLLAVAARG